MCWGELVLALQVNRLLLLLREGFEKGDEVVDMESTV
jgi:hypothetical protein